MRRYLLLGAVALFLVVGGYGLHRNLLSITARACVTAARVAGSAFPCVRIIEDKERGGYGVLRVPRSATHFVLFPLADVTGSEDKQLIGALGREIWSSAWRSREYVTAATSGSVRLDRVGLAANSKRARSQDHLHIHIDCLKPRVLDSLPFLWRFPAGRWFSPNLLLEGNPVHAMRVEASQLDSFDPFAALRMLPDHQQGASIAGLPDKDGGLVLVALIDPARGSEELLDHSCAIRGSHRASPQALITRSSDDGR